MHSNPLSTSRLARTLAALAALALAPNFAAATKPAGAAPAFPTIAVSMDPIASGRKADFDGDGFDDLVVGAPLDDVVGSTLIWPVTSAGVVNVLYGTPSRLSASDDQCFDMRDIGISGRPVDNDHFGAALAAGDFNGDGYADLAVGVPRPFDSGSIVGGRVSVLYGGSGGLERSTSQVFSQDTPGVDDAAELGDQFGAALAAGDFNGDGRTDLAIGAPFESISGLGGTQHGVVHVLYGTASGLSAANSRLWSQDSAGIDDAAESGDHFGAALATGDFDGDFVSDLAIGAPDEDRGGFVDEGRVHVIYGQAGTGLSAAGSLILDHRLRVIEGITDTTAAEFGAALAAGDMTGDGIDDLAVGLPGDDVGTAVDAGSVMPFHGLATRSFSRYPVIINEDVSGISGEAGSGDRFGAALAIGKFGANPFEDLAIGVPGEAVGSAAAAGSVYVFFSASFGVDLGTELPLTQNFLHSGVSEFADRFGSALSTGDFNGDGFDDLVIGVPFEDDPETDCGVVQVVYGVLSGLDTNTAQIWSQGTFGVQETREHDDRFGFAVR